MEPWFYIARFVCYPTSYVIFHYPHSYFIFQKILIPILLKVSQFHVILILTFSGWYVVLGKEPQEMLYFSFIENVSNKWPICCWLTKIVLPLSVNTVFDHSCVTWHQGNRDCFVRRSFISTRNWVAFVGYLLVIASKNYSQNRSVSLIICYKSS